MSGNVPAITERNMTRVLRAIRDLFEGRSNAVGTVTLTANVASTDVDALTVGADTRIFLQPTTANAAAEIGAGTAYVSTVTQQQFTITHANNAQTDRTFFWVGLG